MDDKKFPWNKKNKEPAPFEAVYAGPEYFNPPQQMFQMVYAAPGQYLSDIPAAPPLPVQDDPNAKYCPNCGNKILENARFCHECGAVLPQTQ